MSKRKRNKRQSNNREAKPFAKPSYTARRRVLQGGLGLFGLVLVWHAVEQQIFQGDFLREEGRARHLRVVTMPASRGMITDRKGEPLAISTRVFSVSANPRRLLQEPDQLAPLASALEMELVALRQLLKARANRHFVYLKRRINPDQAARVKALGFTDVGLEREYRRFYPSGEVATHVVGFTNIDDRGQEGMELAYQEWLQGSAGSKRVLRDGKAQVVRDLESISIPHPGRNLVLSIDRRLQYLAYRELMATVREHQARSGTVVLLDVHSGEILAMVNYPSYNPNGARHAHGGRLRNRTVTDLFEPGSTMKPFTVATALELGRYRPDTTIDTRPGSLKVGRHLVKDHRNYGLIDVTTVLRKSSNVGASRIALDLSAEELWQSLVKFGFGVNTESGFPGEVVGYMPHFQELSRFEQATLSFGYGLSVTSLQLAKAYAVLAADGVARPLSLLRIDAVPEARRVIKAATARAVRSMLETVVSSDGTAPRAAVAGYRVAGKTGTAKKAVAGGYAKGKYITVFAGMAPASDPRLVMVVTIDEPSAGQYYAGQVAAPLFSRVMAGALRLMNIAPDDFGPEGLRLVSLGERS